MGARFAMNRRKRRYQGRTGLNFTIGGSGERRVSATDPSVLPNNAVVKALSDGAILLACMKDDCTRLIFSTEEPMAASGPEAALRLVPEATICVGLPFHHK